MIDFNLELSDKRFPSSLSCFLSGHFYQSTRNETKTLSECTHGNGKKQANSISRTPERQRAHKAPGIKGRVGSQIVKNCQRSTGTLPPILAKLLCLFCPTHMTWDSLPEEIECKGLYTQGQHDLLPIKLPYRKRGAALEPE